MDNSSKSPTLDPQSDISHVMSAEEIKKFYERNEQLHELLLRMRSELSRQIKEDSGKPEPPSQSGLKVKVA